MLAAFQRPVWVWPLPRPEGSPEGSWVAGRGGGCGRQQGTSGDAKLGQMCHPGPSTGEGTRAAALDAAPPWSPATSSRPPGCGALPRVSLLRARVTSHRLRNAQRKGGPGGQRAQDPCSIRGPSCEEAPGAGPGRGGRRARAGRGRGRGGDGGAAQAAGVRAGPGSRPPPWPRWTWRSCGRRARARPSAS